MKMSLYRTQQLEFYIKLIWIPAHVGIMVNEMVDKCAKQALRADHIQIEVGLSKSEVKGLIKEYIKRKWQEEWNHESKG